MKTKTLTFITVSLVTAGILLMCLPALLTLDADAYKTFIPLSIITASSGLFVPHLLLHICTKRNKHLQKSACSLPSSESRFTSMYRLARLIIVGARSADTLSAAHVSAGRPDDFFTR